MYTSVFMRCDKLCLLKYFAISQEILLYRRGIIDFGFGMVNFLEANSNSKDDLKSEDKFFSTSLYLAFYLISLVEQNRNLFVIFLNNSKNTNPIPSKFSCYLHNFLPTSFQTIDLKNFSFRKLQIARQLFKSIGKRTDLLRS